MAPRRVQHRRGVKYPPNTMYVGRPGKWGNPFHVGRDGDQAEVVARFERLLAGECSSDAERAWLERALAHRDQLKGRNLACWCSLPEPGQPDICHAAALIAWAGER
jgi:Domain of unknown function (DUF4326)